MFKKMLISWVLVWPAFTMVMPALAEVESRQVQTLQLDAVPIDTAVSADGKLFFVLTKDNLVEIYSSNGQHKDSIVLTSKADGIAVSPVGDAIFLTDTASKKVNVLQLSFVQDIDTQGSPFKGPVDAPVVIALFSDYQ